MASFQEEKLGRSRLFQLLENKTHLEFELHCPRSGCSPRQSTEDYEGDHVSPDCSDWIGRIKRQGPRGGVGLRGWDSVEESVNGGFYGDQRSVMWPCTLIRVAPRRWTQRTQLKVGGEGQRAGRGGYNRHRSRGSWHACVQAGGCEFCSGDSEQDGPLLQMGLEKDGEMERDQGGGGESSSWFSAHCSPHPHRDPSILTPPPLNTNTHTHMLKLIQEQCGVPLSLRGPGLMGKRALNPQAPRSLKDFSF
ncbi:unnamed protein product [Leuciscus chuanchicus]